VTAREPERKEERALPVVESALFTAPDPPPPFTTPPRLHPTGHPASLTPKAALPTERGGRRDRETRGGKSTLPTHELLAEVPPPPQQAKPAPRAKPASPEKRPAPPKGAQSRPAAPSRPPQKPSAQQKPGAPRKSSAGSRPSAQPPASERARHETPAPSSHQQLSQSQIYETLAALLVPYARKMESEMHPKIGFCLKAKSARTGRETHFGAVQALPDGVAFHLFPLYGHPDLLENVSPELYNRLRGFTCFHFESLHSGLVSELAELTQAGFERFLADGVL
jgi:hypothetical protein